jgi:hypothetical protein
MLNFLTGMARKWLCLNFRYQAWVLKKGCLELRLVGVSIAVRISNRG